MGKKKLTQKRLKELLRYEPGNGEFYRLVTCGGMVEGSIAGGRHHSGYWHIRIDRKKYNRSRLAFLYMEGYTPEYEIDHINRVKDDDRWVNLRHVTHRCNMQNKEVNVNNTSGVMGIYWHKDRRKWQVTYLDKYFGLYRDFSRAYYVNKTIRAKFRTCFT